MMFSEANVRLHLTPCTVSEYLKLSEQERDYYDLVDGLLVAAPKMPDVEHERIVDFICAKAQIYHNSGKDISIHRRGQVYVPSRKKYSEARYGGEFDRGTPPSPDSGSSAYDSVREPDVAIGKYRTAEAEKDLSPKSQKIRFSESAGPALVVFEVTSPSTRHMDLYSKWRGYWRSGTQEYVIVDRSDKCVIVGTRSGDVEQVGRQEPSGDPNSASVGGGSSQLYHRKVYRGLENVKCFIFPEGEEVTADLLLHPPQGNDILRQQLEERDNEIVELRRKVKHYEAKAEGNKRSKSSPDKKSGSSDSPQKKKSRGGK